VSPAILPDKYVHARHSILGLAAALVRDRQQSRTVSALWDDARDRHSQLPYAHFVLALDLLYMAGAIDLQNGLVVWGQQ
jgi:hypothetical protein